VKKDHLLPREWVLEALALPEPDRASWAVNVRVTAVLGVVDARGIGFELVTNIRLFEFQNLVIISLTIYITVVGIDSLTTKLRTKII
jgi:phosphonate transport system permease protein